MESLRLQKISRLIQKELSILFQRESKMICGGKMVTVTAVRVSPDLAIAKIYLSIFPSNTIKDTFSLIQAHSKSIRHQLGQKTHNQLRVIPELEFFIDDSLDYIDKIEGLLKPPPPKSPAP
jgi:ribosome-binding factor A